MNMKKITLLVLFVFAALNIHAADVSITETYSNVIQTSAAGVNTKWNGNFFEWTVYNIRRGATDKFSDTQTQAGWFAAPGYLYSSAAIEGGIKNLSIDWAQFGAESGRTLRLMITIDGVKVDSIIRNGTLGACPKQVYTGTINSKKNGLLRLSNTSYTTSTGVALTSNGRFLLGDITWTPYLWYQTKSVTIDGGTKYTNNSLINNLDEDMDAPVYTSSHPQFATVDPGTGEVTGITEGTTTITATSGDISVTYTLSVNPDKLVPSFSYVTDFIYKITTDLPFTNTLTNNSDGTVVYSSSNTNCATINASTGEVTIITEGTTTITASVPETDNYQAASADYTLVVKPASWKMETFDNEITTAYYLVSPQTVAGTQANWTAYLGGIQKNSSAFPGVNNGAAFIKAKYQDAIEYGYIESSTIAGGIDSLSFAWNSNGAEGTVTWDIRILINDNEVYQFTQPGNAAILEVADTVKVGNLKIDGNFTVKFVNMSTTTAEYLNGSGSNRGRFAIDNLQWIGYQDQTTENPNKSYRDSFIIYPTQISDVLNIQSATKDFSVKIYNQMGSLIAAYKNMNAIPFSHFAAGMYIIRIQSENKVDTIQKVLKR